MVCTGLQNNYSNSTKSGLFILLLLLHYPVVRGAMSLLRRGQAQGWTLVYRGVVRGVDTPRISGPWLDISGHGCSKLSKYPTV